MPLGSSHKLMDNIGMSLCCNGLSQKLKEPVTLKTTVDPNHPLIKLMNSLDWGDLAKLVKPDLKRTTAKLKWHLGRKLKIRIHLGAYLLQQLLNETDRGIESQIRDNPVYAVFCGKAFVKKWHVPDHTKIADFRSRLTPATQCALANAIAKLACKKGFANAAHVDVDSTVQKPDMQFPASVNLLLKAAGVARRMQKLLVKTIPETVKSHMPPINFKEIKALSKQHNFEKRHELRKKIESRKIALSKLWCKVGEVVQPVIRYTRLLTTPFIFDSLKKREQQDVNHFLQKTPALLTDLYEHCYDHTKRRAKVFSLNRDAVDVFNKNKHHKGLEFGRMFQIGRIEGNFLYSIPNKSLRMPDAKNLKQLLVGHIHTFKIPIESITADRGYYAKANEQMALNFGIKKVGLQRPGRKLNNAPNNPITDEEKEMLFNRRSGIEPLIGHLKRHWQMGRSRAKTDQNTESSGFASILGFNLKQLMRYLTSGATVVESSL